MTEAARSFDARGARRFLRDHWQKQSLFVPGALPAARDLLTPADLLRLASDERCRSRLVLRRGEAWRVEHGPFDPSRLRRLPARGWALLVQDVNLAVAAVHELMMQFAFIPYARMDDVMVSLAPEGGGVGPHYDSYDVFLVQGSGSRRWDVCRDGDRTLREGLPLRILERFMPGQSFHCRSGDLLYLPPGVAHHGVALETCMTYSVGLRSPSLGELLSGFLAHLEDAHCDTQLYADPDLPLQRSPAMIPPAMVDALQGQIHGLDLSDLNLRRYLGAYLTEPQSHVVFVGPARVLSRATFLRVLGRHGAQLALATRMLWSGAEIFINGECVRPEPNSRQQLVRLADRRHWDAGETLTADVIELAYQWYRAGYLLPGKTPQPPRPQS